MPRPRKAQTVTPKPKKGKPSWDEASTLLVYNQRGDMFGEGDDGFVYRWEENDPHKLQIQKARGWQVVSDTATTGISRGADADKIDDGTPLTTVHEYKELILLRLPEEQAAERREYMQQKADKQMDIVTGERTAGHDQIETARRETGGKVQPARTDVRIS